MYDQILKCVFLVGLIVATVIRLPYGWKRDSSVADRRTESPLVRLLMVLWGMAQFAAVVNVLTPNLDFANYHLPNWAGMIGVVVYAIALWLLWRSHADLGDNWSATLAIRQRHSLVTRGVYRFMRHPMYAAHWLWGIGQALLIQNWIAGTGGLLFFAPLYLLRVPGEEAMMLQHFGQEYRDYMKHTGRVIPRARCYSETGCFWGATCNTPLLASLTKQLEWRNAMNTNKILFPTDFSHTGDAALELATALARDAGSTLLIVHVEEPPAVEDDRRTCSD